jgi:hypothetical protein
LCNRRFKQRQIAQATHEAAALVLR